MKNHVCLHGHFYQPPRENAWTEKIDLQKSAFPFHDWNERILHECYKPNSEAKIQIFEDNFIGTVNNFEKISFNFGPTLLNYIKQQDFKTYNALVKADRKSLERTGGYGNAIAQVYNHVIMPLATDADKETQIIWGKQDFIEHFKREPKGMWLAETAVDTATLELLAKHQIEFTILSPRQAKAYKKINEDNWNEITDEHSFNTNIPFLAKLPSGNCIYLFFYHGDLAMDVAFNRLLDDGKNFAQRVINAFHSDGEIVHLATDGETYGHHHRYGEMGLAAAIYFLEKEGLSVTNFSHYLSLYETQFEMQIHENSSWSCVHGVERWRSDCGCSDGANSNFNQQWRDPLRKALEWLRDETFKISSNILEQYQLDLIEIRNQMYPLLHHQMNEDEFIQLYAPNLQGEIPKRQLLGVLKMQYFAQLMFTSCAWFFDDVSRIETMQVMQYAARLIEISKQFTDADLQKIFLNKLSSVHSNISKLGNAATIFEKEILKK